MLLNIKILLVLQSASLSLIYPFINLHMTSLGFTRSQVTETNIIVCVFDILVPLITGVLAEKIEDSRCELSPYVLSVCLAAVNPGCIIQYLVVRLIFEGSRCAVQCLSEGAVSLLIKKHKADYGQQRILASMVPLVVTPACGYLLDSDSIAGYPSSIDRKYLLVFSCHCAIKLLSLPVVGSLDLELRKKSLIIGENVLTLLKQTNVQRFLLTFVVLGSLWGLIETFLFISLAELGISKQSLGLSQSVATLAGVLVQSVSGELVRRLGYDVLVTIVFILYSVRLFCYSLVTESHHIILSEILKPFGNPLVMVLGAHYITANTNHQNILTLQVLFGSGYFGIGKAIGIFVGGSAAGELGFLLTWRIFSLLSLLTGLTFLATSRKKIKTQ